MRDKKGEALFWARPFQIPKTSKLPQFSLWQHMALQLLSLDITLIGLMLTKNLNWQGRLIRFLLGLFVLGYAVWQNSWIALFISGFIFFEAFMSWCILYQILGINHCPREHK